MGFHKFSFPTLIHFGPGVRRELGGFLKASGIRRPLIITDRGVAGLPFLGEIKSQLQAAGMSVAVFSEIWGNPVKSQVTAGVKAFKTHDADGIVGLGGGAALDMAKAIALMATHSGDLFDYEDEKPGAKPIDGPIPFWVALPTTSGTGSEVGRSSVVSDDVTHVKKIIFSPKLLAKAVFADPELTLELPAAVTASTGMDALTHCVESYLAKGYHPICDGIALEGFRLAAFNLEKAVKNPKDIEARSAMMMSSMMGAIAFQKGLGLTHSCAHALSTVVDLHHGLANGVMIDHALKFNVPAVADRFKQLAKAIDLKDTSPEGFLAWLAQLKKTLNIPSHLGAVGVKREHLAKLTDIAVQDGCHGSNPRPVSKDDFTKIFQEALG
ncbi:MAG TPA: iron-containing alcohol dehydrogenase [Bdellovibrionales bacterium]|nr:iron-containing alcohol dehydrogenase [Bdellovibrionales bacterium]